MPSLLNAVLDAHGGLQNWNAVRRITAHLSLGGPFWGARGWPDVYAGQTVTLDPHREQITFTPFTAPDVTSVLEIDPERITLQHAGGEIIDQRTAPRDSFPASFIGETTPWDAVQVAYFTSAAVWNYLTAPFVLTSAGVMSEEIEAWDEEGEAWRRLAVRFPHANANHNQNQTFYYDSSFMLRRMDYAPDVTGSPPVAHYTHDHRTFDGFVFPTRRRVHLHDAEGHANQAFAPITMDLVDVSIQRS